MYHPQGSDEEERVARELRSSGWQVESPHLFSYRNGGGRIELRWRPHEQNVLIVLLDGAGREAEMHVDYGEHLGDVMSAIDSHRNDLGIERFAPFVGEIKGFCPQTVSFVDRG